MIVPVILAGGVGSRLWPLSREAMPKQFIQLFDGKSLFQQTLLRTKGIEKHSKPIILTNEQHRFLIAEQIRQLDEKPGALILEPCFKGTAPAIAIAAMQALQEYKDDVLLLVMPADHVIKESEVFSSTVCYAQKAALAGRLVTFGIQPSCAHTGYGYIQQDKAIAENIFGVKCFVEKPELKTAEHYFQSKEFWWNSGVFLFSAGTYLQELLLHAPKIYQTVKEAHENAQYCADFIRPHPALFADCPNDSIDYAVMEKTSHAALIPLNCSWSDVGSWQALIELYEKDPQNNVCHGNVISKNNKNCFIQSQNKLVVGIGIEDMVVVETKDAVLVMNQAHSQSLKSCVEEMRAQSCKEVIQPWRVNRPWGNFESIDEGERFHVKRITVEVGQRLSLQRHHHRSEHWVVVKGTARVTRNEESFLLSENQSTYIPIGVDHRLENVGKIPLEIIEVQSGAYLGEDDIVRLDDEYGRLSNQMPITDPA